MVEGIEMIRKRRLSRSPNRGAALLVCVFVISAVTLLVVRILDDETSRYTAVRNTADYERALYLAGAAVHNGLAELEADFSFRGTVTEGSYPADDTYSASVADGANSSQAVVTGTGVSGVATRSLQVTVETGT